MGNASSSDGIAIPRPLRPFSRSGALGLSKSDLERRCQPSGLYPSCKWEDKAIRKLIGDGRLAARLKGTENRITPFDRECPICFLHYSQANVTLCCRAHMCTECYLQVRPQKERMSACPFCNNSKLQIAVALKMGVDDIQEREEDEQRVIAATIRARARSTTDGGSESSVDSETAGSAFGSTLEQQMRARAESFASSADLGDAQGDAAVANLASLALTPDERRALEDEMRAQHSHPLTRRVEAEAEERRLQNEREYYRTQSGRIRERFSSELARHGMSSSSAESLQQGLLSRIGSDGGLPPTLGGSMGLLTSGTRRSGRDWNQIVDAFERGGNGEVQSLDDLVVLEAAILLSMEEESRRNNQEGRAGRTASSTPFDAATHAREGFPLVQQFLSARARSTGDSDEDGEDDVIDQLQSSLRSLGRRRRGSLLRASFSGRRLLSPGSSTTMRSMTEEEQMALAIAASLQEGRTAATGNRPNTAGRSESALPGSRGLFYEPVAVGVMADDGPMSPPEESSSSDDHASLSSVMEFTDSSERDEAAVERNEATNAVIAPPEDSEVYLNSSRESNNDHHQLDTNKGSEEFNAISGTTDPDETKEASTSVVRPDSVAAASVTDNGIDLAADTATNVSQAALDNASN